MAADEQRERDEATVDEPPDVLEARPAPWRTAWLAVLGMLLSLASGFMLLGLFPPEAFAGVPPFLVSVLGAFGLLLFPVATVHFARLLGSTEPVVCIDADGVTLRLAWRGCVRTPWEDIIAVERRQRMDFLVLREPLPTPDGLRWLHRWTFGLLARPQRELSLGFVALDAPRAALVAALNDGIDRAALRQVRGARRIGDGGT